MKISIVVPTYNRGRLIGETLDAILTQTRPADEVIVIDDGSTDDTHSVLTGYGSSIRVMRISNGGDLTARNVGLREAQGSLVAFCDSDDVWEPDFVATMSAQWEAEPGLTACYSDFRISRDGKVSARSKFEDAPDNFWFGLRVIGPDAAAFDLGIAARLLEFQPFFPSCMMVSRQRFLDVGGWDEGVSRVVGGDFATALRVALMPPFGVVRRSLVSIRKHGGNFSGDTEAMNLGDALVLEYVLRTRPEIASLKDAIRNSIGRRRRAALDSAFSRRNFGAVREIFHLLPRTNRSPKDWTKYAIAGLPRKVAISVAALVSR